MNTLLFLSHRIPYPPTKGDKLRSLAFLKHLSQSWRVHLGCFIDDPDDWRHTEALEQLVAELCCFPLDKGHATLRAGLGLMRGGSASEAYFHDDRLTAWVSKVLTSRRPQAAFLTSSAMAGYLPWNGPLRPRRVVVDFMDVDSDKWRQYAKSRRWPASAIYRLESRRLLECERRVAADADACLLVSEAEAALFRTLAPARAERIHGVSNGIDHGFFSPAHPMPNPYAAGERPVVFTGAMDYWPNVDAVTWFAAEIMPKVLAEVPAARFVVVGSNPAPEVLRLAENGRTLVTGRVADVRPYLAHAAAAVAPMRVARGLQNKVLEAMSMARVTVTTPQGWEGIDAEPWTHLLVADGAEAFAAATVRALTDGALADPGPGGMGAAARRLITARYGWDARVAEVARLLEPEPAIRCGA